jgi:hypothetical protein
MKPVIEVKLAGRPVSLVVEPDYLVRRKLRRGVRRHAGGTQDERGSQRKTRYSLEDFHIGISLLSHD